MSEINSGWLLKSPGTKYVMILKGKLQTGVKAKWRRRFFRLHRAEGGTPTQYTLSYYRDDSLQRKLGYINLDDCQKIQASLESAFYQHLFSIQTSTKKQRIYYLASDTEEEMSRWVDSLCRLCNLQDASQLSDGSSAPHPETPVHMNSKECDVSPSHPSVYPITPSAAPRSPKRFDKGYDVPRAAPYALINKSNGYDNCPPNPGAVEFDEDYEALFTDVDTGGSTWKPSTPTPKPRAKTSIYGANINTSSSLIHQQDPHSALRRETDPSYRVENRESPATPEQSHTSDPSRTSSEISDEVVYENPPIMTKPESKYKTSATPPRPPKVSLSSNTASDIDGEDYENCSNLAPQHQSYLDKIYDIPKSLASIAVAPPPYCVGPSTKIHKYVNASTKFVDNQSAGHELYSEVNEPDSRAIYRPVKPARNDVDSASLYMAMDLTQPKNADRENTSDTDEYVVGDWDSDDVYDLPPPARPVVSDNHPKASPVPSTPHRPPKPQKILQTGLTGGEGVVTQNPAFRSVTSDTDVLNIRQSTRTKSYIRDSVFSDAGDGDFRDSITVTEKDIRLPEKVVSSSEEEEEDSTDSEDDDSDIYDVPPARPPVLASPTRSANNNNNGLMPQASARPSKVVPAKRIVSPPQTTSMSEYLPAAGAASPYDIQYVELDQHSLGSSSNSPCKPATESSLVETCDYVEIDARRTKGLSATLEERRRSLKQSSDV